jgi:hypothetical protein
MPRKTKQQLAQEAAEAARAARPFAFDSTAPYGDRTPSEQESIAASIAAAKLAGASGNELREQFGERLTGPARRKVLRAHGLDSGTIARSYEQYRDGDSRQGTRHAREHGARAAEQRAAACSECEQELAAARKAPKGRTKASKAEHTARIAECEQRLALLS